MGVEGEGELGAEKALDGRDGISPSADALG
jgi:hypothetical protein